MRHLLIDLDGCLIKNDGVHKDPRWRVLLGRSNCREYFLKHAHRFKTEVYDESLVDLVEDFHDHGKVTIVTNSPRWYARFLLDRHGFPDDLPLIAGAKKPRGRDVPEYVRENRLDEDNAVIIGDGPQDILEGRMQDIPSIGVTWGYWDESVLRRAKPTFIVDDPTDLEDWTYELGDAEELVHEFPDDPDVPKNIPNVAILNMDEYYPKEIQCSASSHSFRQRIWRFKESKNFTLAELKTGIMDNFFHKGSLRGYASYIDAMQHLTGRFVQFLRGYKLAKNTLLVPAPNSLPEYCYRSDPNAILAQNIANMWDICLYDKRIVRRIIPKSESHSGGSRSHAGHILTMRSFSKRVEIENDVIIIDDITTSGTQINSIAHVLRQRGFTGRIYGFVMGKTI
ncbi:hypothetical protein ACFLZN_01525 [Nanoarchaeota archaeon]